MKLINIDLLKKTSLLTIVTYYFFIQLFFDFLQKFNLKYDFNIPLFHRYIKLLMLVFLVLAIIKYAKKLNRILLVMYVSTYLLYIFSHKINLDSFDFFLQYNFFFSLFLLYNVLTANKEAFKLFYKGFKMFIYLNLLFIIIGMIFDIEFFKTYNRRFGYNGLIISQMQSTVVYISALVLSISKKDNVFIFIAFISGLLVGTKAILFAYLLIILYLIFFRKKSFFNKRISIVLVIFLLFTVYLLFTSSTFIKIYEERGILSSIFSFRNELLYESLDYIKNHFNILNLIIGGYSLTDLRTELDFYDIFLFYGLFGLITIFSYLYSINNYIEKNSYKKVYFYILILVAFFGGNIIAYPVNSLMFILTLLNIEENNLRQ